MHGAPAARRAPLAAACLALALAVAAPLAQGVHLRRPRQSHAGPARHVAAARAPASAQEGDADPTALLEVAARTQVGWTDEHGYCELCMSAVQQIQFGPLPSCGSSAKATSFSGCSQVVQSMLAYAHDVIQLVAYGCYKYSPYRGWQTVRPCPAHAICGRLVNSFDLDKKPHCPADYQYRFANSMAASYPEVKNPLLKYALQALREAGASGQQPLTMMEPFHGGRPEEAPQRQDAYPNPAAASTLPSTAYAKATTSTYVQGSPSPARTKPFPSVTPVEGSVPVEQLKREDTAQVDNPGPEFPQQAGSAAGDEGAQGAESTPGPGSRNDLSAGSDNAQSTLEPGQGGEAVQPGAQESAEVQGGEAVQPGAQESAEVQGGEAVQPGAQESAEVQSGEEATVEESAPAAAEVQGAEEATAEESAPAAAEVQGAEEATQPSSEVQGGEEAAQPGAEESAPASAEVPGGEEAVQDPGAQNAAQT